MKTFKEEVLLAMYRSVDRMNNHYKKGSGHGIVSEKYLQKNLRQNFVEVIKAENE
tara:strand:+ start:613 stop:777 length:165 start_codon:yes stop_codon:yes gene_type:complete